MLNNQARSIGVRMTFTDVITNKRVVLGSSHWPTDQGGPSSDSGCALKNATLTNTKMREVSFDLNIWGVDSNERDYASSAYKPWYKQTNSWLTPEGLNWNDPIYEACARSRTCLDGHWTIGSGSRIDFLFFNAGGHSSNGETVSFNAGDEADILYTGSDRGDLNYSDHRAMHARIYY